MNSLSNERLLQRLQQFEAAGKEARAIEDDEFAEECEDIASVIRELLASREAQGRPLAWVIDAFEYNGNGELTHLRDVEYEQEDIDELPTGTKLYAALQPLAKCAHIFEARPVDGSNNANVPCMAVCKFCGTTPIPLSLSIALPDPSSKAFWGGSGKSEQFHPETYKRWAKEAIERDCLIAGVNVKVS